MTLYFDLSLMNVKVLGILVSKFVRHAFHILYLMYYWWSSQLDRGATSPTPHQLDFPLQCKFWSSWFHSIKVNKSCQYKETEALGRKLSHHCVLELAQFLLALSCQHGTRAVCNVYVFVIVFVFVFVFLLALNCHHGTQAVCNVFTTRPINVW